MPDATQLTDLQIALLRVLWDRREATVAEIAEALRPARDLAPTTIATLLSRLERRGVVSHTVQGRQYVYRARVSEGEVRRSMVSGLTDLLFGGDVAALMSHLLDVGSVRPGDLDKVRALIAEAEGRKGKRGPMNAGNLGTLLSLAATLGAAWLSPMPSTAPRSSAACGSPSGPGCCARSGSGTSPGARRWWGALHRDAPAGRRADPFGGAAELTAPETREWPSSRPRRRPRGPWWSPCQPSRQSLPCRRSLPRLRSRRPRQPPTRRRRRRVCPPRGTRSACPGCPPPVWPFWGGQWWRARSCSGSPSCGRGCSPPWASGRRWWTRWSGPGSKASVVT
jgi:predicted transcriptional regulator